MNSPKRASDAHPTAPAEGSEGSRIKSAVNKLPVAQMPLDGKSLAVLQISQIVVSMFFSIIPI